VEVLDELLTQLITLLLHLINDCQRPETDIVIKSSNVILQWVDYAAKQRQCLLDGYSLYDILQASESQEYFRLSLFSETHNEDWQEINQIYLVKGHQPLDSPTSREELLVVLLFEVNSQGEVTLVVHL